MRAVFWRFILRERRSLHQVIPNYEPRGSQQQMAEAVWHAFENEQHLLVEAATGTGKTMAYLYPAFVKSVEENLPVVIATDTIALQQQILENDVPKLERALGTTVKTALLKGRDHYLCVQKFEHFLERMPAHYDEQLMACQLLVWLTETETGDVEELNLPSGGRALWMS
ncbi:DEAD/DEAH box helicase [Geomicrobium sp. JCM 19039]|uniref:DEAD/DEAH box helicase n=1 Tax=Geomicrobium sp. JCM 19039 TaxID=1460636 RepID=UPI0027D78E89|nr:DEAD/DEAH box helicase [Geomicrobium sp. JCM 19039]